MTLRGHRPVSSGRVSSATAPLRSAFDELKALRLPSFQRGELRVHHGPRFEPRAHEQAAFLEKAKVFCEPLLDKKLPHLQVAVLSPADWEFVPSLSLRPYGSPKLALEKTPVLFVPATQNNDVTVLAASFEPRLSDETLERIAGAGYTYPEAAKALADLSGMQALSHAYVKVDAQPWLDELMAGFLTYGALQFLNPSLAQLWDGLNDACVEGVAPKRRSLADYNAHHAGLGLANTLWYRGKFQQMAQKAYEKRGLNFLKDVEVAFPRGEQVGLSEAIARLERIVPGFRDWANEMF